MMGKFCGNCFNNTLNEQNICTLCGFHGGYNRRLAPHALPAGAILNGRYIIGRILGQGGFGITYTARDHQTGELVAVKEFYPDSMVTRTDLTEVTPFLGERGENFAYGKETFLQEAETMAQFIGNPNIVRVYSYFEENGTAYFVMEYVDGVSYLDYLKQKGGKIGFDDALKILLPVMDALSAVHEKNIIHRDVTPDNIYISKDGTVKLLDFGAARYSLGNASRSLDVILKHGFAPREQYKRRGRQGPYTDVYSLGATLYYSVTGIRPDDALERVDEDLVALPSTLGIPISREQESALMKAMAVDPENRFQSMAEFRHALTQAKSAVKPQKTAEKCPEPEKQKPVPAKKTKQEKKVRLLIPAAAALVCIAAAIFVFGRKSDSPALSGDPTQTAEAQQALPAVTPDVIPETVPLSPEAIAYNEAVDLFYQGEYGKAAIAFGKLGDYRDAREISFRIWDVVADRNTISAGNNSGIAIKNNGTVLIANDNQKRDVSAWDNIISVSTASDNDTVALKSDGTVVATQYGDKARETAVSEWRDIVSVSTGGVHTAGLKADGTVVAAGVNEEPDGTYIGCCDVSEWTDIIDVAAGYRFTVALKADGTVVKTGVDVNNVYEITKWRDIVDIEAGIHHIAGLKADGTVVAVGWDSAGETKVSHWQDITAISAGYYHTLGLRSDGTVVGAGNKNNNRYNVSGWKDVVSVAAGQSILIGLHPDGTVSSGGKFPDWVADWKDIRLPADRDALLSWIKPQHITSENTPEDIPSGVTPAGLGAEETAYNEAVDLFYQGEYGKAAIAFGKLGGYRDAKEISLKIWDVVADRRFIDSGHMHTVGVKADGTVVSVGSSSDGRTDVGSLADVVAITAGQFHTIALHADGTVSALGDIGRNTCEVDDWTNIVQVLSYTGRTFAGGIFGLKSDGTLVATHDLNEMAEWHDLIAFDFGIGLKSDGTVIQVKNPYFDVTHWNNITAISRSGAGHIIGLKSDGTVMATGVHYNGTACDCDVSEWNDIIAVSAGTNHLLGLKSDGTVVSAGANSSNQCNVDTWTDIVAIRTGNVTAASYGIKSDGTVVTAGSVKLGNVIHSEWNDIKLPADRDTLLSQIHLDYIT